MAPQYPAALTLTERVLKGLTVLNLLYGAGILILLSASLVAPGPVFGALGVKKAADAAHPSRALYFLMIVGLAAVPVAQVILGRLRAIVLTVRAGDPFVVENARRLKELAVAVLALELLHVIVGVIAASDAFAVLGIHIDWSFSFTPLIAVLLLFVLARVFEHGTRMRADLEGTV
jgi:hypothetical protein